MREELIDTGMLTMIAVRFLDKLDKQEVVAPFMLRCVFALNYLFPRMSRRMMSAGGNQRKTASEVGRET
jgi:hypothetical protein